jgi:chromosome segregation protein
VQGGIQGANRAYTEARGQAEAARARAQQSTQRRERIARDSHELEAEREKCRQALARAREAYDQAATQIDVLDAQRRELELEREDLRAAAHEARQQAQSAQLRARDLLIQLEGRRSTASSVANALARMHEQREQAALRREQLSLELQGGDEPLLALTEQLNAALAIRFEVEAELTAARTHLDAADAELRQLDERRQQAEHRVNAGRSAMEAARLAAQESRLRLETLAEQFRATRFDLDEVLEALVDVRDTARWEDRLASVQADLGKLGQVNLAAIDELREQSERKTYLDAQDKDLTDALDTLEQAMRKIDRETRTRFEDTFTRINTGLKEKFPRLFGGGHAYLELVGDDMLTAGVAVMARPPGKRISSISQLSGGEKALTAVALVFSIFDLNPAPFCLLDEVDAPLDESNVGRFCEIVREMSTRVQFIFITHNKTAMELASQLVGVTMNEPGVSRLVTVDVDEAVRMAQA